MHIFYLKPYLYITRKLWLEGGIPRFYRGLAPALFQGPLSRFGDTAANTAILALLEVKIYMSCLIFYTLDFNDYPFPQLEFYFSCIHNYFVIYFQPYELPMAVKTGAASLSAGLWRILITPIDTLKTTLQVY